MTRKVLIYCIVYDNKLRRNSVFMEEYHTNFLVIRTKYYVIISGTRYIIMRARYITVYLENEIQQYDEDKK